MSSASFPNEAAIIRLIGAVLLEQNDERQLQHRYMQVEVMAELAAAAATDPRRIPCVEANPKRSTAPSNGMDAKLGWSAAVKPRSRAAVRRRRRA